MRETTAASKHFDELDDRERVLLLSRCRGLLARVARDTGSRVPSVSHVFHGHRTSSEIRNALLRELRRLKALDERNRIAISL